MANLDLYVKSNMHVGIDLQDEMVSFLYGSEKEPPKGRQVLIRRMRRDSQGQTIQCSCVDNKTKEADLDTMCPYCLGSKYYWDEESQVAYWHNSPVDEELKVPFIDTGDRFYFYFKYEVYPTKQDEVIILGLTSSGNLIKPLTRKNLYNIIAIREFREDNRKLAFWRVTAELDNRRYIETKRA